jgi:hypothetical protein
MARKKPLPIIEDLLITDVAAEGKAKALKIEADAEAYYNERVSRSLTPILVQQYAIEKWNGIVPVISGGSGTYVDASKFVK